MQQIEKVLAIANKHNLYPKPPIVRVAPSEPLIELEGRTYFNFASNNYLGLANHPEVKKAVIGGIEQYGVGTCASRLAIGNTEAHLTLERRLSEFLGAEDVVVTSSGYLTNVGVIPTVIDRAFLFEHKAKEKIDFGVIFSDEKNHASIVDGIRLSRAERVVYKHCDMEDLDRKMKPYRNRRKLVVSDAVFSVDGDIAPLNGLVALKERHGALLMLDEAHSFGTLGTKGKGIAEHYGIDPRAIDINMGTLSKALGSVGGYIGGSKPLIDFVRAAASPFVLTAGPMAPALAIGAAKAVEIINSHPDIVERLRQNVSYVKKGLDALGIPYRSHSQIIMIPVGDEEKLVSISKDLKDRGVLVSGMRWPAAPWGDSRIRVSVIATHTDEQMDALLKALGEIKNRITA